MSAFDLFRIIVMLGVSPLRLIVDTHSTPDGAERQHLLSFARVDGITIESAVTIETISDGNTIAIVGVERDRRVLLPKLSQFDDFIEELSSLSNGKWDATSLERLLGLAFLAERQAADGLVTGAKDLLTTNALPTKVSVLTVGEGLAMVGSHVRQRESVPLRGVPPLRESQTEVYPITGRAILQNSQAWQVAALNRTSGHAEASGLVWAVFNRLGQALRGRDGVHEALRTGEGRAAILEALYHFDVLLTSGMAALDALARVAHYVYALPSKLHFAGWQKKRWITELGAVAPGVASVLDEKGNYIGVFDVFRNVRNSIHSIPLDEFLYVERGSYESKVEHRVMLSNELFQSLQSPPANAALQDLGIFAAQSGPVWMNVGQFTEEALKSLIEIIEKILSEMLATSQFSPVPTTPFDPLFQLFWDSAVALARVGEYPYRRGATGLPARPSVHREMMGIMHRAEAKLSQRDDPLSALDKA